LSIEAVKEIIEKDCESGKLDKSVVKHLFEMITDGTIDEIYNNQAS
jgi:hypothetical protein